MDYKSIKESLKRVEALVEDCERNGASEIEHDLILKELREVYSAVRFNAHHAADDAVSVSCGKDIAAAAAMAMAKAVETAKAAGTEMPAEAETEAPAEPSAPAVEPAAQPAQPAPKHEESTQTRRRLIVRSLYEADIVTETSAEAEPAAEAVAEPEPAESSEPAIEPVVDKSTEPAAEEETVPAAEPAAVEDTVIPEPVKEPEMTEDAEEAETVESVEELKVAAADAVGTIAAQTAVDEPEAHETAEPATGNTHAAAENVVLGEVLNADVQTFADTITIADSYAAEVAGDSSINKLTDAIGLNDRFLLIRDLFGGNSEEYANAMNRLDSFDNLNDCMVYIIENFEWNPHCEGSKLLMSLIRRRYGRN